MSDTATATVTASSSEGATATTTAAPETSTAATGIVPGPEGARAPGDGKGIPGTEDSNGKEEKGVQEVGKKWKLKAGDQDLEVDESELVRRAQLGFGAEKRLQDAAKVVKDWNNLLGLLKNPKTAFEIFKHPSVNLDPMKIAEELIYEKIKMEQLTPEQREALEWKQKAMTLEEEKKAVEAEQQKVQMAQMEEKFAKDYETKIISTLEKAGLPKNRRTVARMSQYMLAGLNEGVNLEPDDVVDLVKKAYLEDIRSLFGELDGEKLLEMLGEDVAKKLRSYDLSRPKGVGAVTKEAPKAAESKPSTKRLSKDEWRAHVEKMVS